MQKQKVILDIYIPPTGYYLCIVTARVAWSIFASSTYLKLNLSMVHSGSWSELTVCVAIDIEVCVSQWIDTDRFGKEVMVTLPPGSCENLLASFPLTAKSQSLSRHTWFHDDIFLGAHLC